VLSPHIVTVIFNQLNIKKIKSTKIILRNKNKKKKKKEESIIGKTKKKKVLSQSIITCEESYSTFPTCFSFMFNKIEK